MSLDLINFTRYLQQAYNALLGDDMCDGILQGIHEVLNKKPELVQIYVDMFEKETCPEKKELLAEIIIYVLPHEGAINYLLEADDDPDWSGYPGFEKWLELKGK